MNKSLLNCIIIIILLNFIIYMAGEKKMVIRTTSILSKLNKIKKIYITKVLTSIYGSFQNKPSK